MSENSFEKENNTLENGAWEDTFDKLLGPREALKELNILKKDVHASFNIDSSVDNCSNNSSKINHSGVSPHIRVTKPKFYGKKDNRRFASISTPVGKQLIMNPFKCSLSPICDWKMNFEYGEHKEKKTFDDHFHATPINPELIVAEYEAETLENVINQPSADIEISRGVAGLTKQRSKNVGVKTTSMVKRKPSNRHVFFETIADKDEQHLGSKLKPKPKPIKSNRTVSLGNITAKEKTIDNIKGIETRKQSNLFERNEKRSSLALLPGKWRRTLNIWRRTNHADELTRQSVDVRFSKHNESVVIECVSSIGRRKSIFFNPTSGLKVPKNCHDKLFWKNLVLERCNQSVISNFMDVYKQNQLECCKKIGEGAYGEVFLNNLNGDPSQDIVLKIIPIEGHELINGEIQKTFEQILPEIVISVELCELGNIEETTNATKGFIGVKKVACVQGKYPDRLIQLWEQYDESKGSENDHPNIFTEEQIFIVLELSYGGRDLETFEFHNAEQSYYALQQIVLTLAVGEISFKFEHRDLHWGNILLLNTIEKNVTYKLHGKTLTLPTKGVKTTIIDYTLSRMDFRDYCFYNDLATDEELFSATGDYQFDIYRMMRDAIKNNWEDHVPKTNVYWISYLTKKMLDGVTYKSTCSKTHSKYMSKLKQFDKIVLNFMNSNDCAKYFRKDL